MRNPSLFGRTPLLCFFLVSFVFAATLCYADVKTVEVVGVGECAGCKESNIKTSHALSGMYACFCEIPHWLERRTNIPYKSVETSS